MSKYVSSGISPRKIVALTSYLAPENKQNSLTKTYLCKEEKRNVFLSNLVYQLCVCEKELEFGEGSKTQRARKRDWEIEASAGRVAGRVARNSSRRVEGVSLAPRQLANSPMAQSSHLVGNLFPG